MSKVSCDESVFNEVVGGSGGKVEPPKVSEGNIVRLDGAIGDVKVLDVIKGLVHVTLPAEPRPEYIVAELDGRTAFSVWVDENKVVEVVGEGEPIICEALRLFRAGFWVIPAGDGKDCVRGAAQQYRDGLVTEQVVREWLRYRDNGLEVVGPPDRFDCLDFDDHARDGGVAHAWRDKVEAASPDLLDKVCVFRTRTGEGRRVVWLAGYKTPMSSTTLAASEDGGKSSPLVERLVKMFVPCRGTADGVPESWPYRYEHGHLADLDGKLSEEEAAVLLDAARSFNEVKYIEKKPRERGEPSGDHTDDPTTPWGHFNIHASWSSVLEPKGWTSPKDGVWVRPGGTGTRSAVVFHDTNKLFVHSASAAPFEKDGTYNLFDAFTLLYHDGDRSGAARTIIREGWGNVPPLNRDREGDPRYRVADDIEVEGFPDDATHDDNDPSHDDVAHDDDRGQRGESPSSDDPFETWDQVCAVADSQKEDWYIRHWAEFGTLLIFSGLPFSGKSTMLSEVIAASANGTQFAGMPVARVPLILLDLENKERILVGRLRRALGGKDGAIRDIFHRVNPENIQRPLTTEFVGQLLIRLRRKIGEVSTTRGVVIIDTMRSAFAGDADELDAQAMVRLLTPLKQLAYTSGWLVVVLHHNAKYSNQYSGSTAIAAVADYLWNWQREEDGTGKLSMEGRGDAQEPLAFAYDMAAQRSVFLGTTGEVKQHKRELREVIQDAAVLTLFPATAEDAIGNDRIGELIMEGLGSEKTPHKQTVRKFRERQLSAGRIAESGSGKNGDPHRYHLTADGSRFVLTVAAGKYRTQ